MAPTAPRTIEATCVECEAVSRFGLTSASDDATVAVYACPGCDHRIALDLDPESGSE